MDKDHNENTENIKKFKSKQIIPNMKIGQPKISYMGMYGIYPNKQNLILHTSHQKNSGLNTMNTYMPGTFSILHPQTT